MLHIGWLLGRLFSVRNDHIPSKMEAKQHCDWSPLSCFQPENVADSKVALIVLNRPIYDLCPLLKVIWNHAALRAAADGGANRLMECTSPDGNKRYVPDILTGDFDSVRPEVLLYCKEKHPLMQTIRWTSSQNMGCTISETPDQNYTDFTKCLQIVIGMIKENKLQVDRIVVFGAFGGRLDQTLSNINTALTASSMTNLPLYLLGDECAACLLHPGSHRIAVDSGLEGKWCGLVPIVTQCRRVKTTGLKWNLENQSMQFGGLISTSNTYAQGAREVTVSTDQPLLWTMGIRPLTSRTHVKDAK